MSIDILNIQDSIQMIIDEETEAHEMLPENMQESERADTMQEAIDSLEQAEHSANEIEMAITDCFDLLEQAKGEL
jgi:hypothetical protein